MAWTTLLTLRTPGARSPIVPPTILPRLGIPCGFCRVPIREGDRHGVWDEGTRQFVCRIAVEVYDPDGKASQA